MSEIGTTFLGRRMRSFRSSPEFDGFSKVVIVVSDEIEYSAGTDSGRTLRITNPWGTPQMAKNILSSIRGFQYQPFEADGAILDPAAELGDGITANNVYSGVYTKKIKFGPLLTASVAAPEDEEINHEYPYKSKPNREITRETRLLRASLIVQENKIAAEVSERQSADKELHSALSVEAQRITAEVKERKSAVEQLTATLKIQAAQIEAKVSKTGGNASSFGWTLTDYDWTIKANSKAILKATKNGLEVYGKITATSGKIGGFDILSNYLSYNNQTWGGTNSKGIYIGVSGIQMGKYFKVDSSGNLTARSGRFEGTVYAGRIEYDDDDKGRLDGSALEYNTLSGSRLEYNTVSTDYTSSGINTSLGYADRFYDATIGDYVEEWYVSDLYTARLFVDGSKYKPKWIYYTDSGGNATQMLVLAYDSQKGA